MAIRQCSECGGKVSTRAVTCPHCGAPKEALPPEIEEADILESVAVVDEPEPITQETISAPSTEPEPVATKDERFNQGVAFAVGAFVFMIASALGVSDVSMAVYLAYGELAGLLVMGLIVCALIGGAVFLLTKYGKKQSPQAYAGIIGALFVVSVIAILAGPIGVFRESDEDKERDERFARMDSIAAAWQAERDKERDERFAQMDSLAAEYYRSPVPEPEAGSGESSPGDPVSRFVTVMLPKGVSLEMPRNWSVLSNGQRRSITSFAQSLLDLTDLEYFSSGMRFAANLFDDDGVTMGLLNVRYYPELDVTQAEARALSEVEVQALDASVEEAARLALERAGVSITSWAGTAPRNVNGLETFVSEYQRVRISGAGRMLVRLVRVLAAERSFTLTISYAEEHEELLQPMTDRIIASIALDGIVPPSGPQASPSPMNILFGEQWQIALLLSLVLTWGIGLAPPLLIRFVILRRPPGNPAAVGLAGSFYLFNVFLFMALGSQSRTHTGLVLVALASYAILRIGGSRRETEVEEESEDPSS
jgi:hypothetical protein